MLLERIQLEPDETVLTVVRRHWFVIVAELLVIGALALAPLFIISTLALFPELGSLVRFEVASHLALSAFLISGWCLLLLLGGFMAWTHYYLDLWIITDRRIILVDQIHFFNRSVHVFRLERLQDIEYSIKGLIPTFLNFGTLIAQTASAGESNFKSSGLPDPRGLQAIIQKAMDDRLNLLNNNPNLS